MTLPYNIARYFPTKGCYSVSMAAYKYTLGESVKSKFMSKPFTGRFRLREEQCMTYNEAHSGHMPIYVTICPGLYCTSPYHCPSTVHRSPSMWTDAVFHLWKNGGNPCPPPSKSLVRHRICQADFTFRENISSSRGPPGPAERGTPIEIRGGIKEQGFARRGPWGSPAVGDLTPAHSQSWQSKAAQPGAESV